MKRGRKSNKIKLKCQYCNKSFEIVLSQFKKGRGKYCSKKCFYSSKRGNKCVNRDGYITLNINGKKVLEHRLIWEKYFSKLESNIHIHHLNGIKTDNRIENLIAMKNNEHSPKKIIEPYKRRILKLEKTIKELKNQTFLNMG